MYRIDPKPFEAELANANADLATCAGAVSRRRRTTSKRLEPLAAKQAVTQQELDDAIALREAAQAQVAAQNASVDKARLDVGYTVVNSPITGLVGTTLVRAGALVGRGESTLLTTVSQIDPILFTAGISEAEYLRIARRADQLRRQLAGRPVQVELLLADGTVHPQKGRLDAVERAVDATTGTLSLQFRFPNPGGLIRPGQYGRVRFVLETKKDALLVPQRAVQELQNLYNVTVVGADNKLVTKTVTVGPRVGSQWMIESGLDPSDRVVVEGASAAAARHARRLEGGTGVASGHVRHRRTTARRAAEVAMARFFINRPIVAMVLSIVMVLLGTVAMLRLPIAQYPEIVPPMVQVTTTFVGAGATDVETAVATPLEQKINGVENMIYMKSTNANDGTLTLKVSFDVGTNLDMANVLTQNRVSEAHAAAAAVGEELRRVSQEVARVSAARHLHQVSERHLRQQLPVELRHHQHQRQHRAHPWRRPDQSVRRQRLRHARLAQAGPHRQPGHHRAGHRQRHQSAEPAESGRSDRRAAVQAGHGIHLCGAARRADCSTRRSSATSSSARIRTGRRCC